MLVACERMALKIILSTWNAKHTADNISNYSFHFEYQTHSWQYIYFRNGWPVQVTKQTAKNELIKCALLTLPFRLSPIGSWQEQMLFQTDFWRYVVCSQQVTPQILNLRAAVLHSARPSSTFYDFPRWILNNLCFLSRWQLCVALDVTLEAVLQHNCSTCSTGSCVYCWSLR